MDGYWRQESKTLPGSTANCLLVHQRLVTAQRDLCEGQPDFCAALLVAWFEDKAVVDNVARLHCRCGHSIHPGHALFHGQARSYCHPQ